MVILCNIVITCNYNSDCGGGGGAGKRLAAALGVVLDREHGDGDRSDDLED